MEVQKIIHNKGRTKAFPSCHPIHK